MKTQADLHKIAANEVPVADHVPFGVHVAPNVIKLRNTGDYIATWQLEGAFFETASAEDLNTRTQHLNSFLCAMGGGQFALWSHRVRREIKDQLTGNFSNRFCADLNDRYFASLAKERMMVTELYLTLVYRPSASKALGLLKRMRTPTVEEMLARDRACLDKMKDVGKQVQTSLHKYRPERLTTYSRAGIAYSGMATFLGFLINGIWEEVPLRRASLAEYLPSARLHFGDRSGILQIEHPAERKFAAFLDFQEYPAVSTTGMLDPLLYGDYEYIETQSFSMLNKRDALERLKRQRNQLISGEEASASEIRDMAIAEDQVQGGSIVMGEYHYTLAVFGATTDAAADNLAEAVAAFNGPGIKVAPIDAVPEAAWFAQLPGNWAMRPREASITSLNFACLSAFHNFASGKRSGNPWGEAVTLLRTQSGKPFFYNWHTSPEGHDSTDDKLPGHTALMGYTGVGKTTLLCFLLAQSDKFDARMVAFDKDRGLEILIRAMGGKYRTFRRGEPTGINPFQWPITPENTKLCEDLVKTCVGGPGVLLTATEDEAITKAVNTVLGMPSHMRRLGAVHQNLPAVGENSLRQRLTKWVGNNKLGWVADNPRDTLDLHSNRKFGFDYTVFLDDPEVRPVVMLMLLHATQGLIDGTPFMLVMEEFWKPMKDQVFRDFAEDKLKTMRKEGGMCVFITQSPSDVLKQDIGKSVVESCVTQAYLANPRASRSDYVDGFKVTPEEFDLIKNLPEAGRTLLVKQGDRSVLVKLDLEGFRDELVVLSGSIDNVELLDRIRAEVGDDPDAWMPILLRKVAERRALAKAAKAANHPITNPTAAAVNT